MRAGLLVPGSSPHTRGAHSPPPVGDGSRRIIPAYAGSTSSIASPTRSARDHPRIRGEHSTDESRHRRRKGSSPHTRGALSTASSCGARARIIPAYAGSTAFLMRISIELKDHPRIRGEHPLAPLGRQVRQGSSPHTRGAQSSISTSLRQGRIIPAYAGSTASHRRWRNWPTDHPRIRGEHPGLLLPCW